MLLKIQTPGSDDDNPLCRDGSIDAAVSLKEGETFVFKFSQYWKLTDDSVEPGYPKSISKVRCMSLDSPAEFILFSLTHGVHSIA